MAKGSRRTSGYYYCYYRSIAGSQPKYKRGRQTRRGLARRVSSVLIVATNGQRSLCCCTFHVLPAFEKSEIGPTRNYGDQRDERTTISAPLDGFEASPGCRRTRNR